MVTIHVLLQGSTEEDVRLLRFAVEGGREQAVAGEIRFKKKKKRAAHQTAARYDMGNSVLDMEGVIFASCNKKSVDKTQVMREYGKNASTSLGFESVGFVASCVFSLSNTTSTIIRRKTNHS